MALFNSREKTGIPNFVERSLGEPSPSKTITDILIASVVYLQKRDEINKDRFVTTLQSLFDEKNHFHSAEEFAQKIFNTLQQSSLTHASSEVQILHFETFIIRSLNEELGIHIELPLITYLRDICVCYRDRIGKDIPRDKNGNIIFNTDNSYNKITCKKYKAVSALITILSHVNPLPDKLLEEFKTHLNKVHPVLSQTRDPWYIGVVKQLFSLGFINLYRHLHQGNLTHGDQFFHNSLSAMNKNYIPMNMQPHGEVEDFWEDWEVKPTWDIEQALLRLPPLNLDLMVEFKIGNENPADVKPSARTWNIGLALQGVPPVNLNFSPLNPSLPPLNPIEGYLKDFRINSMTDEYTCMKYNRTDG